MKNIILLLLICTKFVLIYAQSNYDTIFFTKNKLEITDTSFVFQLDSLLKNPNITCKEYKKHNSFSVQISRIDNTGKYAYLFPIGTDATDIIYEAVIIMLPIGKWQSNSKGYFYIDKSLFFISGEFPDNFIRITQSKKRFFYKNFKPNKYSVYDIKSEEEFCLLVLHFKNGRWIFVEERQNY